MGAKRDEALQGVTADFDTTPETMLDIIRKGFASGHIRGSFRRVDLQPSADHRQDEDGRDYWTLRYTTDLDDKGTIVVGPQSAEGRTTLHASTDELYVGYKNFKKDVSKKGLIRKIGAVATQKIATTSGSTPSARRLARYNRNVLEYVAGKLGQSLVLPEDPDDPSGAGMPNA